MTRRRRPCPRADSTRARPSLAERERGRDTADTGSATSRGCAGRRSLERERPGRQQQRSAQYSRPPLLHLEFQYRSPGEGAVL